MRDQMKHPTLYKRTSTGKTEQWTIWTQPGLGGSYQIVTEHGQLGGKLQQSVETVTEGKNLGRANATTAEVQAESQALAEWTTKKTRKGYTEDLAKAQAGGNDGAGGLRPMLAKDWNEHKAKLVYPCFAQPKLDGIRCIAIVTDTGAVELWSREQKPILACPHVARAIEELKLSPGAILDGELYNHSLKDDFETIVSCVRKPYPASLEEQALVQYHIYDLPSSKEKFGARNFALGVDLHSIITRDDILKIVETKMVYDEEDLVAYRRKCQLAGYEGAMARNDAPYEIGKRSAHLQKLKEFLEEDFPVVSVKEGKGNMAGLGIFRCTAANGLEFDVKMEGPLENLRQYVDDESTWRGKKLTVKFFSLTKKGIPRFPVGKVLRDYE